MCGLSQGAIIVLTSQTILGNAHAKRVGCLSNSYISSGPNTNSSGRIIISFGRITILRKHRGVIEKIYISWKFALHLVISRKYLVISRKISCYFVKHISLLREKISRYSSKVLPSENHMLVTGFSIFGNWLLPYRTLTWRKGKPNRFV